MKKCKVWFTNADCYRTKFAPELSDAMMIGEKVLIPGVAWWDTAYEIRRKKIKKYCVGNNEYYGLGELPDITPKEALELERSNPLWFCVGEFAPAEIIDGVPYYVPFVYSDNLAACPSLYPDWTDEEFFTLLPFELNGKWGYVKDYSGEIVVQPTWDFAEPFCYGDAVVGQRDDGGSGKACDFRCMKGDKLTIDDKPNIILQLHHIVAGDFVEWTVPRLKNETFCKKACTVHFAIIDQKGNLQCPLEPDNDYITSHRRSHTLNVLDNVTVIQKNGKFYIELQLLCELENLIGEADVIDAADESAVETKIGDILIFIQRNDLRE